MQQETVRNCRRDKSKILRKQPETPNIKCTKLKSKELLSCITVSAPLIVDRFEEAIG